MPAWPWRGFASESRQLDRGPSDDRDRAAAQGVLAREGARHLRAARRPPADGGDRPDLGLRPRAAQRHTGSGQGADTALDLLVLADALLPGEPPRLGDGPGPAAHSSRPARP